ncbi:MAG: hypothetical protein RLZZ284_856 [Actinomycetota bacterium]
MSESVASGPTARLKHVVTLPAGLGLFLFGFFVSLEVSPRTAALAAAVICSQIAVGHWVLSLAIRSLNGCSLALLGPSFIVGAIFWVFPVQLLGSGRILNIAWLFMLVAVTTWRGRRIVRSAYTPEDAANLSMVLGLTLVFLSAEWPQFSITVIVILALGFVINRARFPKPDLVILCAAMLSVFATAKVVSMISGSYWWIVTDDYSYHESMSLHLANYGIWTQWGTTDVALYHWFTNAWIGQVAQVTLAEPWETLTRVAPVAFGSSLVASLLILGSSRIQLKNNSSKALLVLISAFVLLTLRTDLTSPSTYAVLAVIASGLVVIEKSANLAEERVLERFGLILVILLASVFTKFTSVTSALLLSPHALISFAPTLRKSSHIAVVLRLTATLVALSFLVFAGPAFSDGWEFGVGEGLEGAAKGIAGLSTTYLLAACSFTLLTNLPVRTKQRGEYLKRHEAVFPILESAFLGAVSLALLVPGLAVDIRNYFALPFLLIAVICLFDSLEDRLSHRSVPMTLLVAMVAFGIIHAIESISPMESGSRLGSTISVWASYPWLLLGISVLVLAFGVNALPTIRQRKSGASFTLALAVAGIFLSFSGLIQRTSELSRGEFDRDGLRVAAAIGDPKLVEVGIWLKQNLRSTELFATDLLCESDEISANSRPPKSSCSTSSVDMTLANSSQRRFLVLAPRFSYQNSEETEASVKLSLRFAQSLDVAESSQLISRGVTYFVLDNRLGQHRDLLLSPVIVFRNDRYLVIDLRILSPKAVRSTRACAAPNCEVHTATSTLT